MRQIIEILVIIIIASTAGFKRIYAAPSAPWLRSAPEFGALSAVAAVERNLEQVWI